MKFFLFVVTLLFSVAQSHKFRANFLGPSKNSSFVQKASIERLTKVIRDDLNSKVDEVVDLIATDLERELLKGGLTNLSLLQQGNVGGMGAKAKQVIKKTLVGVLKSVVPMFETWIHDAVQPPVVDRNVYSALIQPVGFGISEQLHEKLHIDKPNPWKEDELEEEEDEMDEDGLLDDDDLASALGD
ncbi:conserved hypothetical protein [Theileria orientalis strain Shintoku]|uniref:Cell-traversal protein for ookinetes and sporozoites domain-containing protein n=1 Tax=Theileria orientalis strain Shintoku TaxID=869250 RepID=J7M8E0_THEOR|nr:conserved hypothetical protein [Theileria orientalis strain Shintoku]BAM38748.1 conserved hypothetical protein [Theileria orientalis strain Shintoku]|eukprot:XP_009689049.1 conserved hypothetical protein [Theileria orientalis strain Shintoku]